VTTTVTYVRTRGGDRVHLATCRNLTRAKPFPWHWAQGMTPAQIAAHPVAGQVRACRSCLPDWPEREVRS